MLPRAGPGVYSWPFRDRGGRSPAWRSLPRDALGIGREFGEVHRYGPAYGGNTTQVLIHELTPAPASVADALVMTTGDEVVHIERLRFARGEPLAIMRNWLPPNLVNFTSNELAQGGLYDLLRASGVQMRVARQRIGARPATPREAKLLGERRNACMLTMERVAYDDTGRAVEFGTHVYRAKTYSFETTLVNR